MDTHEDRSEIRSGPGYEDKPIAVVSKGDVVSLRTTLDQWSMVVTADGVWGWFPSRDLLDLAPLLDERSTDAPEEALFFGVTDPDTFTMTTRMLADRQELGFSIALRDYRQNPDDPGLSDFIKPRLETIGYAPESYRGNILYPEMSCVLEGTAAEVKVATTLLLRIERKLREIDFETYILDADPEAWAIYDRWGFFDGTANRRIGTTAADLQKAIDAGGFCD